MKIANYGHGNKSKLSKQEKLSSAAHCTDFDLISLSYSAFGFCRSISNELSFSIMKSNFAVPAERILAQTKTS